MMFGGCQNSYYADGKFTCLDNNKARNISEMGQEFKDLLTKTCPALANGTHVCCNYYQLDALASQTKIPTQLFSRCPACLRNFLDHFCTTTCDPDQSLFMNPTMCMPGADSTSIAMIDIYLSKEYAHNLFDSCETVQDPQASTKVVNVMCGGADVCTAEAWLEYLGNPTENHNSPLFMNYVYDTSSAPDKEVEPKQRDFIPCNSTDPLYQCGCADCGTPDLCPNPPQKPKDTFPRKTITFSIWGVGCFLSVVLFVIAMILGLFSLGGADRGYRAIGEGKRSKGGYGTLDDSPTSSIGSVNAEDIPVANLPVEPPRSTLCMPCYISGAHLENFIKTVFYHWGRFVAQYWPLVILVGVGLLVVVMALTGVLHVTGVAPFLITTDPVKLWSAPDSRARQEKDYFDQNFNPFYRTEMLIVTAKNKDAYFTFSPLGVITDGWTFGPVFTNDVLFEVRFHAVC